MVTEIAKRWLPKVGDTFSSRDDLIKLLENKGWKLEGCGTGFKETPPYIIGWDIGVEDKLSKTWVMIDLKPYRNKAKVVRIHYPVTSPKWNLELQ